MSRAAVAIDVVEDPSRPLEDLLPPRRRRATPGTALAVAVLGSSMAFLDATIVNIAIPSIRHSFSGSPLSSISWVLSAYNIVFAAFLVGGGQLADLLGRRRVFSSALVVFTLGSALCAVASSLGLLIFARMIQAVGAAMLVPSSLAIVLEAHTERTRTHAVAMWSAAAALAAGIGPPLGGLLVTASSWRLVFLVNLPVGALAFTLTGRTIIESRAPGRRRVPDLLGAIVLACAIACLVLAVVKGQEWGWGNGRILTAFAGAVVLGGYFVWRSANQRVPVVDLSLLRIRAFALSNAVTVVMAAGFYAYTLCNVLFLTGVWRYSILQAGLALAPGPITAMAVAAPASRLVERFGHRVVVVPGALIWGAGMAYFATVLGTAPDFLGRWLPGLLMLGVGAGLSFPTLSGAAVGSVPGPRFAVATSLNSVARQVGAALGIAALIAILGRPSPLQALHAFEHGWLFACGCFAFGAVACLGLRVKRPSTDDVALATGARARAHVGAASAEHDPIQELAPPELLACTRELPALEAESVAAFLRNVPVFAPLPEQMRAQIADVAEAVSLPRDHWLFHEGDAADSVYVVRLGQLEIVRERSAQTVNTLTRGAVLGELALLEDSVRNASARALRDSELLRIRRPHFEALLRTHPELGLGLARALGAQLKASRAIPVERRPQPVTIALCTLGGGVPRLELANELSWMLSAYGRVAVLYSDSDGELAGLGGGAPAPMTPAEAVSEFGPLVERCELENDQVLLVCDAGEEDPWSNFCLSRADRVLVAVDAARPDPERIAAHRKECERLRGCDLIGCGVRRGAGALEGWLAALAPAATFAVRGEGRRRGDLARVARRLAGQAIGVVFSGGGARAFAHISVVERLQEAGIALDRVGGVSMGAFVAGLLALDYDAESMDACCFEEWVQRNPLNDYTFPRTSLIRGEKVRTMLERVFTDVQIEELDRAFYTASVDLRSSSLVIDRSGPLYLAVGTSMSLPLIVPPHVRTERLLIDGSLLDNLPLAPMTYAGEGPVLAVDVKPGRESRPVPVGGEALAQPAEELADGAGRDARVRIPSLPETMRRVALLSSANTTMTARTYADFTIEVRIAGVGLFEFHQIDEARRSGREAAETMLQDAPEWLCAATRMPDAERRTVLRV